MPGTVLSVLPHAILATFHLRDIVHCCPTLQVRKLRFREAKFLLYLRARKCPLGLKPGLPDPQTIPLHLIPICCGPKIHFLCPKTTVLPLGVDHGAPNVTTTWSLPHRSPHFSLTTVSSVVSEHSRPTAAFTIMVPTRGCWSILLTWFLISFQVEGG